MRHHEETIAAFTARRTDRAEVLGVVVVGSMARGDERPDSDVDGYVDVKLASPWYLRDAVDHGDDPTRASFDRGRVILDRSGELVALVARMADLPSGAWGRRVTAYQAQLALYGSYFLVQAYERGDRFLLQHSAVHACLAAGQCLLAHYSRLFRGQKYLAADLARLPDPDGFVAAWWAVLEQPTPATAAALVGIVDAAVGQAQTVDDALSTFILGNELAWLNRTIPPEFW